MNLVNIKKDEYGDQFNDHILEQWKTCAEMANCNSERRINSNNIYIAINAAIIALTSFSFSLDYKSIVMSIVGIIVSILWQSTIKSYKELNRVKYRIINEIEKMLPISPHEYEWKLINEEDKYKRFTYLETFLPWIFIFLYSSCILAQLKYLICSLKG
ncbi:hypothetical protein SFBM_0763 [Candidatus Arthromitus sp. SFB-mouse-Japan]|uniref:RipA family octameric membrane protein n=1 Tax=Candidatus Arthromitus sp. SFB-mouse TaxID=49118 RepID=UPI00021B7CB4|nr:hypothetical protein [Candidatus Arthromitus sp. SFB-mouse]BAK56535.1 hypothetical protein SFBM_0763 [Candidatus Arthromitus sp. SFB-mouse-Japan]